MNIFVSSASSYVGSYITARLLDYGFKVSGTYRTNLEKLEGFQNHKNFKAINLIHGFQTPISTYNEQFDVLINSTGSFPGKNNDVEDILSANIKAAYSINLQSKIQTKKPKLIINFSSLSVYGDLKIKKINKSTLPSPIDLYGTTKLLSEQIISNEISEYLPVVHIRFPVVLGKGAHRAWLPTLREKIIRNEQIKIYNKNSYYSSCTTLKAVFDFVMELIKNKIENGEYFSPIGSVPDLKLIEIFNKLSERYNYSKKPYFLDSKVPCCSVDSSSANLIGYKTPTTSECIDYWLS